MINKAILLGRVGKDPEVKEFENGGQIANFSIATTDPAFKTKDGKEIPERTEWHNITVRGGLVKVVQSYVSKGQQLYIEGKIKTRSYEQDGVKKYVTEIYCDVLKMLGSKSDNQSQPSPQQQTSKPEHTANNGQEQDDFPF